MYSIMYPKTILELSRPLRYACGAGHGILPQALMLLSEGVGPGFNQNTSDSS